MIFLIRDIGIDVDELQSLAEGIKKDFSIEVIPILETFQPSLSSFDFERGCYDRRKLLEEVSRALGIDIPIILMTRKIKTYGFEDSFCDLELKVCILRKLDKDELKKLIFLLL